MRTQEKTAPTMREAVTSVAATFDPESIKKRDFPIFERLVHGKRLVYLDNAATTQKPRSVIHAVRDYYHNYNANAHRGAHTLSAEATNAMEASREKVAQFIGGVKQQEIIFTRNATEAINLVAYSWARKNIKKGQRIVITEMEHHANLVPWLVLAREIGAELKYIPINDDGLLNLNHIEDIISANTKLVAITQMSNLLGTINPVNEIIELAHRRGALALVDGAQSAPHMPVDVRVLDSDFFVFSGHKMLGPTGIGALYGKESILEQMEPFMYGGEMISEVRYDYANWNELPWKFEAGTPDIAGAIGFSPALEYLTHLGMDAVRRHGTELTEYALDRLGEFDSIRVFGPRDTHLRGPVVSFVDKDIHPHDLATFLDTMGIAIRAGHHCAQPLTRRLGVAATARASFYIYNTKDDVDSLVEALKSARRYFAYV